MGTSAGRWVLAAAALGFGTVSLDATVVGLALPAIGRELHLGLGSLQCVVAGFSVPLSGLLLLAGALSDRYGRRRLFVLGGTLFAGAAVFAAAAPNAGWLIGARVLEGIAGALLTPGSIALLQASFTQTDRTSAVGAWSGLSGLATAAGPFLAGSLLAVASWRWVFLLSCPVAVAAVVTATRHVPESAIAGPRGRLDWVGALLATGALTAFAYAVITGAGDGWGAAPVQVAASVFVAGAVAFVLVEARTGNPILPLRLFRSGAFTLANAATVGIYAALGGTFFLIPITLQQALGFTPLAAGASLLPVTVVLLLASAPSGVLAGRIGPAPQLIVGPLVLAAGLALLAALDPDDGYTGQLLPGVVLVGAGLAVLVPPLTSRVLAAAPTDSAGTASGVNNFLARAAGMCAVATLPGLVGLTGAAYRNPAALLEGYRTALLICAGLCLAASGLVAVGHRVFPSRLRHATAAIHGTPQCAVGAPLLTTAPHRTRLRP